MYLLLMQDLVWSQVVSACLLVAGAASGLHVQDSECSQAGICVVEEAVTSLSSGWL